METLPPAATAPTAPNSKWYEIWMDVWTHPGEEAFWDILKEKDHSATRGFIWIAVTSLIVAVVNIIGYVPISRSISSQFENAQNAAIFNIGSVFTYGICLLILTPIIGVIGVAISTGIYHLISRLFKSTGTYSDLVFCMAAVSAPTSIIVSLIALPQLLLSNFPAIFWLVAICFGIVAVVLAIYAIVMQVNAIRGAEKIGTWQAVLTIFLPVIIIGVLTACCLVITIPAIVNSTR